MIGLSANSGPTRAHRPPRGVQPGIQPECGHIQCRFHKGFRQESTNPQTYACALCRAVCFGTSHFQNVTYDPSPKCHARCGFFFTQCSLIPPTTAPPSGAIIDIRGINSPIAESFPSRGIIPRSRNHALARTLKECAQKRHVRARKSTLRAPKKHPPRTLIFKLPVSPAEL